MQVFGKQSLDRKLMLALGLGLISTIAAMIVIVVLMVERNTEQAREQDMRRRNLTLIAGVQAMHKALDADVNSLMASFKVQLGKLSVGPGGELLAADGAPLANRYAEVDTLAANEGANATVFEKRGTDFVRITTSVKKADGSRAVGTKLATDGAAYAAVDRKSVV